jgi:uncharacterized protein YqeY
MIQLSKLNLQTELKEALKAKDNLKKEAIRSILSAIQYTEMEKGTETLSTDEVIQIVQREIKKRKEELEFAEKAVRLEAVATLHKEIEIIQSILPKQLSIDELRASVASLTAEKPGIKMGEILKSLREQFPGQVDAKVASEIIKGMLAGA